MSSLDRIFKTIAEVENRFTEPDIFCGISLLVDIRMKRSDVLERRRCQEYIEDIEIKTNDLLLVVRRLREAVKSPFLKSSGAETRMLRYFRIDLESFFYFARSVLDLIARLTPYFYPSRPKGFKSYSFEKQRKWFMKNDSFDPDYSRFLINRTEWFDGLRKHRDQLTHYRSITFFWRGKPRRLFFGTKRNEKGFIPNQDALDYVNRTANSLIEFLSFLNSHFSKKTTNT